MQPRQGRWTGLGQRIRNNWLELVLVLVLLAAVAWIARVGLAIWSTANPEPTATPVPKIEIATATPSPAPQPTPTVAASAFDPVQAQGFANALVALGPRIAGSPQAASAAELIARELRNSGWQVEDQIFEVGGVQMRNVVGKAGSGPAMIVGAHFDTSPVADLDPTPDNQGRPVTGANDGASGPAVLLELARTLDKTKLRNEVWLAFLDGQYPPAGRGSAEPVSAGAGRLVESLAPEALPQAVIMLDMVGDTGQQFHFDGNSDTALSQALWDLASRLGYAEWFIPEVRHALDNGVLAFRDRNVPAANVVNYDYPFRRTAADTLDKLGAASLEHIGRVLQAYLEGAGQSPAAGSG